MAVPDAKADLMHELFGSSDSDEGEGDDFASAAAAAAALGLPTGSVVVHGRKRKAGARAASGKVKVKRVLHTQLAAETDRANDAEAYASSEAARAATERQWAEAERQRADDAEARATAEKQRATAEKQRADAEKQRADAEKQRADDATWATISSLPHFNIYSKTKMVPVPAGDPTHALLAAELQRTAKRHRWRIGGQQGPLQEAPKMEVTRIERIMNRRLQESYLAELQNTIGLCKRPADPMDDVAARRVESCAGLQANEFLLFNGAPSSIIERLQEQGLDPRYAGTNRGKMFGVGSYMATDSSKSDLYTEPNADGERCIMLVRAALGEPARLKAADQGLLKPPERPDGRGPLSSVVGLTRAAGGVLEYPEYIVYKDTHTLPQYAIWYKHAQGCRCTNCVTLMCIHINFLTGETISLEVARSDTIGSVKAKIQASVGIPLAQQMLKFGDTQLEDDRALADYNGLLSGSTLHCVKMMSIHVQLSHLSDLVIDIQVKESQSTESVKVQILAALPLLMMNRKIALKSDITDEVRAIFLWMRGKIALTSDGTELQDGRTLDSYGIEPDATIIASEIKSIFIHVRFHGGHALEDPLSFCVLWLSFAQLCTLFRTARQKKNAVHAGGRDLRQHRERQGEDTGQEGHPRRVHSDLRGQAAQGWPHAG